MAELKGKNGHVNKLKASWMPLDCHDYLDDTQHLTTLEHGAYLLLIMHYWNTGSPIKLDENFSRLVKHVCKLSERDLKKVSPNLLRFFTIEDGLLKHRRIDQEISTSNARRAKFVESGKRGGLAKQARKNDGESLATLEAASSVALANNYTYTLPVQDSSLRDSTVIENGVTPDGCTIVHGVNFGRLS